MPTNPSSQGVQCRTLHIHRYSPWTDTEVRVSEFGTGRIVKGLRQLKRCRKCNKLKIRKVYAG